jgi:hypothetical protein
VATNNSIINKTMDIEDLKSDGSRSIIKELNVLIEDLSERRSKVGSWFGLLDETEEDQRLRALKEKQQHPRRRTAKQRLARLKRRLRRRAVSLKDQFESIQGSRAWRLLAMPRSVRARLLREW